MKTLSQTQDHSIRTLRADEVDAVTGGVRAAASGFRR